MGINTVFSKKQAPSHDQKKVYRKNIFTSLMPQMNSLNQVSLTIGNAKS